MEQKLEFQETSSRLVKTFVVEHGGYKASVNLTVNFGKIEQLSGNVAPMGSEEPTYNNPQFHAYKRNGKWCTDVTGAANDEQDAISDICVAIVDQIVAEYETAEE